MGRQTEGIQALPLLKEAARSERTLALGWGTARLILGQPLLPPSRRCQLGAE